MPQTVRDTYDRLIERKDYVLLGAWLELVQSQLSTLDEEVAAAAKEGPKIEYVGPHQEQLKHSLLSVNQHLAAARHELGRFRRQAALSARTSER